MRVHLLAVPNCPTDPEQYPLDGFCFRTWAFSKLLKELGHEVVFYGVEGSRAFCDLFVAALSDAEWRGFLKETPYQDVSFDPATQLFLTFNTRAAGHLRGIKRPGDVIATIGGQSQLFVSEHHPELRFLEYSIGYKGVCAPFRVYESHAWRHIVHGFTGVEGWRAFDTVIPPWWDVDTFPVSLMPGDYVAFCGRIRSGKGITMACRAAEEHGIKLVAIGHGEQPLVTYGEYVGAVSNAERNRLIAGAAAVLMPTQYLEPFGNVAAEAQLCGTPVLGPPAGAFVETIAHGLSGYHCATTGEYVQAIDLARQLDRRLIRERAVRLYGTDAAKRAYTTYFRRMDLARSTGTDSLDHTLELYGSEQSDSRRNRAPQSPARRHHGSDGPQPCPTAAVARFTADADGDGSAADVRVVG